MFAIHSGSCYGSEFAETAKPDTCVVTVADQEAESSQQNFVEIGSPDVLTAWGFADHVVSNFAGCVQREKLENLCLTILDDILDSDKQGFFVANVNAMMAPGLVEEHKLQEVIRQSFNLTGALHVDQPGMIRWLMNGLIETVWWSTHRNLESCFDRALHGDVVAFSNINAIARLSQTQCLSEDQKVDFLKKLQHRTLEMLKRVNTWVENETVKLNRYDYDDSKAMEVVAEKQKLLTQKHNLHTRAVCFYSNKIAQSLFNRLFGQSAKHRLLIVADRATLSPVINVVRLKPELVADVMSLRHDELGDINTLCGLHGLEVPRHRESVVCFRQELTGIMQRLPQDR